MPSSTTDISGERRTIVLAHGDERVIVAKPMTYENLEYWTRQLFALSEQDLSFYAMDIDVCPGKKVMIHRNAYEVIGGAWGVLHVEAGTAAKPALIVIEDLSDDEPVILPAKTGGLAAHNQGGQRIHRRATPMGDDRGQGGKGGHSNTLETMQSPGAQRTTFSADTRNTHTPRPSARPELYREESQSTAAEQWLPLPSPTSTSSMRGDQQNYRPLSLAPSTSPSRSRFDPHVGGQGTGGSSEGSNDDKIEIIISHRPTRQSAKFKARPHMKVARVTYGVCKAFGLDYQTARLHLIVRSEGQSEDYTLECDEDDSMAMVGLQEGMLFLVSVDGDPI